MILVVGAGPAGLAAAHALQQRGLPYRVLERYGVGHSWSQHYDRLRLNTLKQVSSLPGLPMPSHYPTFPTATQFHTYLNHYADRFQLNITTGIEVQQATWTGGSSGSSGSSRNDGGWSLETSRGAVRGDTLIAATGIWSNPIRPAFEGAEQFGGTILHSQKYTNPSPFQGQRVLVIGAGNSGAEIAVDLSERGIPTGISILDGVKFVPRPSLAIVERAGPWLLEHLPRPLSEGVMKIGIRDFAHLGIPRPAGPLLDIYPVVGYGLPEAVAAGKVTVHPGTRRFFPGRVQFEDGSEAPFDTAILATGYRPALQFVAHEVERDARGQPVLDRSWRSTCNPHLLCVGFWYPSTRGWLQSIGGVVREAVAAL